MSKLRSLLESREYVAGQLLKCSPEKFPYWLEYHDDLTGEGTDGSSFSPVDVRQFEKICENLGSEDVVQFYDADGEEDYSQDDSETEDYL